MQIQIDAPFFLAVEQIKPVHAHDDRIFFKRVGRAAGNVADEFFFADGRGVGEAFGNVNFFALHVRADIFDNRTDNHGKNFLRVELEAAGIIVDENFIVAQAVENALGVSAAVEDSVGEGNFPVGGDFAEFVSELLEVDFAGGGEPFQEFWRSGLMIAVGEFAHFVDSLAQIIGMRLERNPERLESVKDAGEFFNTVALNVP